MRRYRIPLTAREWILLPKEEQEKRARELSASESFLLRTLFDDTHFTEEQKKNMSAEKKKEFLYPKQRTQEEIERRKKESEIIFKQMIEKIKKDFEKV